MNINLLLVSIFLPILSAPVVFVLGRRIGKRVGWVAFALLLSTTVIIAPLIQEVQKQTIIGEYGWTPPPVRLTFGLLADGLSIPVLFTLIFVFSFSALHKQGQGTEPRYYRHR